MRDPSCHSWLDDPITVQYWHASEKDIHKVWWALIEMFSLQLDHDMAGEKKHATIVALCAFGPPASTFRPGALHFFVLRNHRE